MVVRIVFAAALIASTPAAAEIASAYTDLDDKTPCATVDQAAEGDGDWAEIVCPGFMGFPVVISYGDARESVFYGFPPQSDDKFANWESFGHFNSVGPKVEWRYEKNGDLTLPFATIHRWFVSQEDDSTKNTEVLVIEKVGSLAERDGCRVGYVVATGDPQANEKARKIADEQARTFSCAGDEPVIIADGGELPEPMVNKGN
ncbi:MAG: hypothetical protein IPL47_03900 [Phyllobacteriaceae bacterium]|nr:hypothetical protein [Phyllobacteriaceae bacterium]